MSRFEGVKGLLAGLNMGRANAGYRFESLPEESTFGFKSILYWFAIAAFFILLVLVLVHYTVRPIFSFAPGDGGLFALTARSGKQTAYTKTPPDASVPFDPQTNLPCGFTLSQDILVAQPNTFSQYQRVFLYRGPAQRTPTSTDLAANYPQSNIYMYLEPDTNDLVITVRTQKDSATLYYESAPTIYNVPIGKPFRVVIVLLPQMLEVYLNGRLHSTTVLSAPPVNIAGKFFSSPTPFETIVKSMNWAYWPRPLTAKEIAANNTGLMEAASFNMPTEAAASTCT